MNVYIHYKMWDEATCPFQKLATAVEVFKFGNGQVIQYHVLQCV